MMVMPDQLLAYHGPKLASSRACARLACFGATFVLVFTVTFGGTSGCPGCPTSIRPGPSDPGRSQADGEGPAD